MVALSARTREHVHAMFAPDDVAAAERLLEERCGDGLPLIPDPTPDRLERFRFAVLRLSGGRLDRLEHAVASANRDWRDVLVAAGFANDLRAHLAWVPKVLPPAAFDAWRAGRLPDGVRFGPGAEVIVTAGWAKGQHATILDLARIDPEPTYRAMVSSRREVVIGQSLLSSADSGPGGVSG